jgi:hypothetical protein
MAKGLKTLANQLKRNHGVLLVPTFDAGVKPGTLLAVNSWNNIDRIGHLTDDRSITADKLGAIEGPTPCLLADFKRTHELQLDAALDLIKPKGTAKGQFKRAREVVASFDSPVTYSVSLLQLEDAVETSAGLWQRNVGQRLRLKKTRVVFQVVRAKLSFLFRGSGGAGMDLKATSLGKLSSVGLGGKWSWRNEATLESKEELVVAVEAARYAFKKKRFITR